MNTEKHNLKNVIIEDGTLEAGMLRVLENNLLRHAANAVDMTAVRAILRKRGFTDEIIDDYLKLNIK